MKIIQQQKLRSLAAEKKLISIAMQNFKKQGISTDGLNFVQKEIDIEFEIWLKNESVN